MKLFGRSCDRGVALTVVMIILILLALIGGYVVSLGYNQRRMVDISSGEKIRLYYNAQAGIVDANWRIRNNIGAPPVNGFFDFTVAGNALAYALDDGTIHANVTISAVGATRPGLRDISSIGRDA